MNAQARALGQVPIEDDADSVASLDAQCTSMLERASKLHPCKVCSGLREKAMGHNYAFLESRAHEKIRTSVQESTVVLESRAHLFTKAQYFHGRHSLVSTDAKQIRFGLHRLICTAWSAHTHTHTHTSLHRPVSDPRASAVLHRLVQGRASQIQVRLLASFEARSMR